MRSTIIEADLAQKINETVCRYNGQPVYVRTSNRRGKLHIYNLHDGGSEIKEIDHTDPLFDISSIPLGYVQRTNRWSTLDCTRIPIRRVRQGLCATHMRANSPTGKQPYATGTTLMFSQGFHDMVLGIYRPLEQSLAGLRKALADTIDFSGEAAVNIDTAISINSQGVVNVYYKNELVGWMEPDKNVVHVKSQDKSWIISKYLAHVLGWVID